MLRRIALGTVTALVALLLAWGSPAPASDATPRAYTRAVELVRELYLRPDEVTPEAMLHAAADGLSGEVDWLLVDHKPATVFLRHGDGRHLGRVTIQGWDDLAAGLHGIERLLVTSGVDVGGVDVRHVLLDGATDALDRHSKVLIGDGLDRFDTRLKGTLVGIGARLAVRDDQLVILGVFDRAPAERAGLRAGDRVLRIDGRSTVNMPTAEAVRRIRGATDTEVELELTRDVGEPERATMTVSVRREKVVLPNVAHRVLEGDVGYLHIDHVSQRTMENVRRALRDLDALGALENGLVLDVRGNTGGSMKESARVVDALVSEGLLLATVGRDGKPVRNLMARMDAQRDGDEPDVPVVALVDRRTASGAEIIVGGLLEHERIAVVGQRTYGKGQVQKIYDLDGDARLKLTVAEYVLEHDTRVGQEGIAPDVVFGEITLQEAGVRYRAGWDLEREDVAWDAVHPIVREHPGWRAGSGGTAGPAVWASTRPAEALHAPTRRDGVRRDPGDLELEVARRAVLRAPDASREAVLAAVRDEADAARAAEEAHLTEALEARGVGWSPAAGPGARPEAWVQVVAKPGDDPDSVTVETLVQNLGPTTLHRALVRLRCDSLSTWDDLVIPVGAVPRGATVSGRVRIQLRPGLPFREDEVRVELRADQRPALDAGVEILSVGTTPQPRLQVAARLLGEGPERTAHLTVTNLDDIPIRGLEAEFRYPQDLDVELVDHGSRRPLLPGLGTVRFDLGLRVGEDVADTFPLQLRLTSDSHDRLVSWEVPLGLSGDEVLLRAPDIVLDLDRPAAPVGQMALPLRVYDDRALTHAVVFLDGDKVNYTPGDGRKLLFTPTVPLAPGGHRLRVEVTDDQGLVTVGSWTLLGLGDGEGVAADD